MPDAATFAFDVIDDQAHLGCFPGHLRYQVSAAELVRCLDAEGMRFALTSSASSTTIGESYGTREMLDAAERYPDRLGARLDQSAGPGLAARRGERGRPRRAGDQPPYVAGRWHGGNGRPAAPRGAEAGA